MSNIGKKDLKYLLFLIGIGLLFFSPELFFGQSFWYRDIIRYLYPNRLLSAELLTQGAFPLWNPYQFCGMPLFADLQNGILHPLSALFYLFPFMYGFKTYIVAQFLLGSLLMYLVLRFLRISGKASFIGAAVFLYGGPMLSTINIFTLLQSIIWVPVIYLLFRTALQRDSFFFAWLTGIAMVIQLSGGQPEIIFQDFMLILFVWLWDSATEKPPGGLWRGGQKILLIAAVPALLMAVQLLPFRELVLSSDRQLGVDPNVAMAFSMHPLELVSTILPNFTYIWSELNSAEGYFNIGSMFLKNMNIGILPILLFFLAIRKNQPKQYIFFYLLGLLSLVLILGKHTPVYGFLYQHLPGFNLFRYPAKFIFFGLFAFSVIIATGYDKLLKIVGEKEGFRGGRWFIIAAVTLAISGLVLWYYRYNFEASFLSYVKQLNSGQELLTSFQTWAHFLFGKVVFDYLLLVILSLAMLLWTYLALTRRIGVKLFGIVFTLCLLANLAVFSYYREVTVKDAIFTDQNISNMIFLKENLGANRIYVPPKTEDLVALRSISYFTEFLGEYKNVLLTNIGQVSHLSYANGYSALRTKYIGDLVGMLKSQPGPSSTCLLDLMGVKYVISMSALATDKIKLVHSSGQAVVYQNMNSLPLALLVPGQTCVRDAQEMQAIFNNNKFDPRKTVLLAELISPSLLPFSRGQAQLAGYQPTEVSVRTSADGDAWLLLTDAYYPGWKAFVDGREQRIIRADHAFSSVLVSPGQHMVQFIYVPASFYRGLIISVLGWLGLSLFALVKINRAFPRRV